MSLIFCVFRAVQCEQKQTRVNINHIISYSMRILQLRKFTSAKICLRNCMCENKAHGINDTAVHFDFRKKKIVKVYLPKANQNTGKNDV